MSEIRKRPQVISDLIRIATYIAENNLENSAPPKADLFEIAFFLRLRKHLSN